MESVCADRTDTQSQIDLGERTHSDRHGRMIVKDGAREAPKPRGMVGDPLAWGLIIRETIALLLVFVFQKRDENSAAALPPPQAASHSCAVGQV
jgi:hypothetical protein